MSEDLCSMTNVPVATCVCSQHALEKGLYAVPEEPLAETFGAPYDLECAVCQKPVAMGDPVAQTSAGWTCPECLEDGL